MLYEKYSHNKGYKFEVHETKTKAFQVKLLSYEPDWKEYSSVHGMEQVCNTMDEAIKLGSAMLALLE